MGGTINLRGVEFIQVEQIKPTEKRQFKFRKVTVYEKQLVIFST